VKYEGDNGQIEIRERELVITREGFRARAAFGKNTSERRIPLEALSGVNMKEATRMMGGWLQLLFGGEEPTELSTGTAGSNANTITFAHKKRDTFRELHARLLAIVNENSEAGIDPGNVEWDQVSGQRGRFDERASPEWAEKKAQERLAQAEASGLRPDIAEASTRMKGTQFGAKREIKKLHEHLHQGEQVVNLAAGTYDGKQGIVALTDQRLLFVFHGLTGHAVEDFPLLEGLTNVQTKAGMVSGDLTVYAAGKSTVIKSIYKDDLKELADALRQRIATGKQTTPPAPAAPLDVADELAKLAVLRDQGVLTEDEFASQKAKLLNA
jgi:hypothetical protein